MPFHINILLLKTFGSAESKRFCGNGFILKREIVESHQEVINYYNFHEFDSLFIAVNIMC